MTAPHTSDTTAPLSADALDRLLERARLGDASALPALRAALDDRPGQWAEYSDLAARVELAMIQSFGVVDLVLQEATARRLAALREEVAGPSPTPLESLLAERIAITWLQCHHADALTTQGDRTSLKVADLTSRRQNRASRRLIAAIGALATLRRLIPGAVPALDAAPAILVGQDPIEVPVIEPGEAREVPEGLVVVAEEGDEGNAQGPSLALGTAPDAKADRLAG